MDTRTINPSPYLNAADVDTSILLTVKRAQLDNIGKAGEEPESKIVVAFEEIEKMWILNVTNLKAMQKRLGFETDNWIGKKITLMRVNVEFRGEAVAGLRLAK